MNSIQINFHYFINPGLIKYSIQTLASTEYLVSLEFPQLNVRKIENLRIIQLESWMLKRLSYLDLTFKVKYIKIFEKKVEP